MSDNELIALYIGLGTVIGSFLGAIISTFLGRAQKISTFRQEWINSLRLVFSELLLQAEIFTDVAYQNNEEAYKEKTQLIKAISKAKVFLNLREEQSKKLIEKIEKIPDEYMGLEGGSRKFKESRFHIEECMRDILKEEWNRVRDGEFIWKIKKLFKKGGFLQEFYCSRLVVIIITIISIIIFVKLIKCT